MIFTTPFDVRIALYVCIILVAGMLLFCVGMLVREPIVERARRKQYPKWYERYDRALKNAFCIGCQFRDKTETINKRREMIQETFLKNKCSEEEYKEAMRIIANDYTEAVNWFNSMKESFGIEADLKDADKYAKENDLKWGIIYED